MRISTVARNRRHLPQGLPPFAQLYVLAQKLTTILQCRPFISGVIWPAPVPPAVAAAAEPESATAAAAPQAGPSRTGSHSQSQSQSNSQDSLPTPDPSSDGIEIVSAPTPRREKTIVEQVDESAPAQNLRKHERSPSADELVVTEAPEAKRVKMDDESHPDCQTIDPKPLPARAVPTEAAQGELPPQREAPATSSPAPARPQFRDSSVQTSPPPEESREKTTSPAPQPPAAAPAPAAVERPSPRPRTRSPPPARPAAPLLATLERTMASSSYVNPGLPRSRADSRQIFSLLRAGAAEQQQRLERERNHAISDRDFAHVTSASPVATPPVQPAVSTSVDSPAVVIAESSSPSSAANASTLGPRGGFRNDVDDASAMACDPPVTEPAAKAEKSATSLGPTSSAILMPPPTAASRESPIKGDGNSKSRAAPSQALAPVVADPAAGVAAAVVSVETVVDATPTSSAEHSATTASQDPSTQSSDSVVRDSQEQASTQSSGKEGDASFPSAAQVRRDRSTSVIFPQPGFTGTTTATVAEDGNVTMDPPSAAQTVVVGTPDPLPNAPSSRFLAPPSSDHVDSTLKDFGSTGSSGRTASTDETKSPQATRPTPVVVDESASGKTAFDFASLVSPPRQLKRECSEPPLEYRSDPSVSGRARASSLPVGASQNPPRIAIKERSQPTIDKPTVGGPAAPETHESAAVAESTAATETDGIASEDDLDSALRTNLSVEELVQHFDAMEESRQSAQKAASLPASEAGVSAAVAAEVAVAVSYSGLGNTRDTSKEVPSGLEQAPEKEDAIAAANDAEQAKARLKARVESEAAERRRIAEEKASEGELVDDDEVDELSEGIDADVGASSYGDLAAPMGEPFSQAALLTQAIDEPGSSLEDQASDQDGAVLTRRRSFANLEDEAELSEHEQDEVNKVLNEDMWGYLDLLKRDI